jgi:hypothetical protein
MSDAPEKRKASAAAAALTRPVPNKADTIHAKPDSASMSGMDMHSRMPMTHLMDSVKTPAQKPDSLKVSVPALPPNSGSKTKAGDAISVAPAAQPSPAVPTIIQPLAAPKANTRQNITVSNDSAKSPTITVDTAVLKK